MVKSYPPGVLLLTLFILPAFAFSQRIAKVTVAELKRLAVFDEKNSEIASLILEPGSQLASYSTTMIAVRKYPDELVIFDARLKEVSKSVLKSEDFIHVSHDLIIVISKARVFVFDRNFVERTDYSSISVIRDIIQAKINYNLAAGARKDKEAFWSIFADDYSYRETGGEIFTRQEAEAGFVNSRRGLVSVSPETKIVIDSIGVTIDTAVVYTNQHYVRTEWGNDQKTHVYVSNVTHRETWYRMKDKGWLCHFIDELTEGPFSEDGVPYTSDTEGKNFTRVIWEEGLEKAKQKYFEGRKTNPSKSQFEENTLNNLGYSFLKKGRINDAIEIFKINVDAYPDSYNVYDSLGEAYMLAGNTAEAILNYEKSLHLNPKNENAENMLRKLK